MVAPQALPFPVAGPANMTLTFDGGHAIGIIGPGHHCKAPVRAKATITVPPGASTPTGNVTFAITDAHASVIPVELSVNKVKAPHHGMPYASEPNITACPALKRCHTSCHQVHACHFRSMRGSFILTMTC